jgi:hypothetical protein
MENELNRKKRKELDKKEKKEFKKERRARRFAALKKTIAGVFGSISGIQKTDGLSPISLVGRGGKREIPGFTPNEAYNTNKTTDWYGNLLDSHPDYKGKNKAGKDLSTEDRFNLSKVFPRSEDEPYSTRDWHLIFNDTSMDYFKHGLQVIDGKNFLKSNSFIVKNFLNASDLFMIFNILFAINIISGLFILVYKNVCLIH